MRVKLFWWRGKRPSVHIADVPLDPMSLPWVKRGDVRPGLSPLWADGITYHAPDPEFVKSQEPLPVWGGNTLEIVRERHRRAHA